jgi:hypothetical protein
MAASAATTNCPAATAGKVASYAPRIAGKGYVTQASYNNQEYRFQFHISKNNGEFKQLFADARIQLKRTYRAMSLT